ACLVGFSLVVACAQPNLSGIWKSEAKSDQILKIDQQGSTFAVSVRTPVTEVTLHSAFGPETKTELNGIPITTSARWEGSTVVLQFQGAANGNEIHVTDRYTISNDGNKVDLEETRKLGNQPEVREKRVLMRLPSEEWLKDPGLEPADKVYKNLHLLKG